MWNNSNLSILHIIKNIKDTFLKIYNRKYLFNTRISKKITMFKIHIFEFIQQLNLICNLKKNCEIGD